MAEKITMAHGSGGRSTDELIDTIFAKEFDNPVLDAMEDSAVVPVTGRIALTTDSFVVTPLKFRGGDIGRLCVCGTVNDLLMRGAVPAWLTCGFILEEGLDIGLLKELTASMAATAREAGIKIAAGDTKVVEGHGGMYINTAGVGIFPEESREVTAGICASAARESDAILVSGTMGDHHAAILSERMEIETDIESDNAPLVDMVGNLLKSGLHIHTMRDVTRGGLATVLRELAEASGKTFIIRESAVPVNPKVKSFAGLLGLDPVYMGNEGKMVVILPQCEAEEALQIIRQSRYGSEAAIIGRVTADKPGELLMETDIGGLRRLDVLQGEGLPRIC
ncbi:MAG: hydrogenase expression/formation protein HypE [Lachnospira sp.]|nr:hydrogenase expression/formation protein HypE [Lachnospira sp.]